MIREIFRNEIGSTLKTNTFFSFFDFKITEEQQNVVNILYLPDNKYYFQFDIPTSTVEFKKYYDERHSEQYSEKYREYYYSAIISPWKSAIRENVSFEGKKSILNGIKQWMTYLKEDLLNTPINRKVQEHEEKLNELSGIIDNVENDYLSENEKQELINRINDLELHMIKNIDELNKKSEEKEILINSLKEEIELLKEKMQIFNKKNFFRTFAAKIVEWAIKPENQKLIGNSVDVVKNLIENKKD
jgi:hypothetical protein